MKRFFLKFLSCVLLSLALWPSPSRAEESKDSNSRLCQNERAAEFFQKAYEWQQSRQSRAALDAYLACLRHEPDCVACNYEIGWSYWALGQWAATIKHWERVLTLQPDHSQVKKWLDQARDNARASKTNLRVKIGTESAPADGPIRLTLVARFQNYNDQPASPADHYDQDIYSPKSVRFSPTGDKVYVNSLEGGRTVIYDPKNLVKKNVIPHIFKAEQAALFQGQTTVFDAPYPARPDSGALNQFIGKPVESAFSHNGRFLWVPYYRRSFDQDGLDPSAVAIIDTVSEKIVRVMPTGPIPKYVVASPDNHWLAVIHWGDNTAGIIDITGDDPQKFQYLPKRLVVERVLPQTNLAGKDRDDACGFCLRGAVFSPDSQILLIARMGGGGIAGFRLPDGGYLGTVVGMKPTPRHLLLSPDNSQLYVSSNISGYVSRINLAKLIETLKNAKGQRVGLKGWEEVYVSPGARTIDRSADGQYIFAAVNHASEVVVVDTQSMKVVSRIRTDSYPVGLAVSPDGKQLWTTSQGQKKQGGNSVCVYDVKFASK
jgi:YVTN family beta-propeller protein